MKLKTFKTLQHNITYILHINSSNKMFGSIHDSTFLMTDTKFKGYVSFESSEKKKLLPAWFSLNLLCCLSSHWCWQINLPVCLPPRVRSCRSHWQACFLIYQPNTINQNFIMMSFWIFALLNLCTGEEQK